MNENETQNTEEFQPKEPSLKRHFYTVTPFSKYLAMTLFVALPFVGLFIGMMIGGDNSYGEIENSEVSKIEATLPNQSVTEKAPISEEEFLTTLDYLEDIKFLQREAMSAYQDRVFEIKSLDIGEEQKKIMLDQADLEYSTELEILNRLNGPVVREDNSIYVVVPENLIVTDFENRALCIGEWKDIQLEIPSSAREISLVLLREGEKSGPSISTLYRNAISSESDFANETVRWDVKTLNAGTSYETNPTPGDQYRIKAYAYFIDNYYAEGTKDRFVRDISEPFRILDCGV